MATASWPATIGRVSTPTWVPRIASCSIAAGRRVSSEAISTRLPSRSLRRLASFAVVVVLPEPCRPTIRIGAGGEAMRRCPGSPSPLSISISASWTILTTCCPGVTDLVTAWPRALSVTDWTKLRATGSETSASSSAVRTSRSAVEMSSSVSAPWRVSLPKTPESRSERVSNIGYATFSNDDRAGGRNALTGGDPARDRTGGLATLR